MPYGDDLASSRQRISAKDADAVPDSAAEAKVMQEVEKRDTLSVSMRAGRNVGANEFSVLPYYFWIVPFVLTFGGVWLGGAWAWSNPIFIFGIIPVLDLVVGVDSTNVMKAEEKVLEKRMSFRYCTWVFVPAYVAAVLVGVYVAVTWTSLTTAEYCGFVFSVGMLGALAINTAHELIHKPNSFEQSLGKVLLVFVCYGHFFTEHLYGHHKRVSTDEDPATSRLDESLYTFLPRTIRDSLRDAWTIEAKRMQAKGRSPFHPANQVLLLHTLSALVAAGIYLNLGATAMRFFFIQAAIGALMLEIINYIEHFGLRREKNKFGEYERVTPLHSWNASETITNYFLFKLQRHSDHHAYARRRYQILRTFEASPQMPTGYAGMVLLSIVPFLWFRVMVPRVEAVREQAKMYAASGVDPFKKEMAQSG